MKGGRTEQFKRGDHVQFLTDCGTDIGTVTRTGKIRKLHNSGRYGVAEISPDDCVPEHVVGKQVVRESRKKVSRKLQHVSRV